MNLMLVILGTLLVIASIGSGFAKIKKVPAVIASMASVGVGPRHVPILAGLEIAGGAGLIIGIWNRQLGLLASICLTLYFAGALISHLRKKHGMADFGAAFFLLIVAISTTLLQLNR